MADEKEGKPFKVAKLMSIPAFVIAVLGSVVGYFGYQLQHRSLDRNWHTQLLITIYDSGGCPKGSGCPPKADVHVREDAVKSYIKLQRSYKEPIDLRQAFISLMMLSGADLRGANLSGGTMHSTNLGKAKLTGALFIGADLTRAVLDGADMSGSNFSGANLQGASLINSNLVGIKLVGASLGVCGEQQFDSATGLPQKSADLRGANLKGAILEGVHLCGVNLRGADLTDVKNLSQEALDSAEGDDRTSLPSYRERPKSWDHH